ncbi:LamG domain-containing protein (plasmid) [Ensifer adhaerens]|uniref:LamG domain-containing protein n=1 Tax=Ensifer adhaerens TaxID=106592 RepID=UPI00210141C1|nr:LamG domain-containing protein [Ensifer adhaerens]UTV41845.1 LamG domain-containing protein [Ensifer adhaerens]
MSLSSTVMHNNTNVLRVRGPDGIGLKLADIVSLGGASPFGYSAWIRPLATLRPFRYSEQPEDDFGFLIGTTDSGWRLFAHDEGITAYRAKDRYPFMTLPCRLGDGTWHFLRIGWSSIDETAFCLSLAVDEFCIEGFDSPAVKPSFDFPKLKVGGGSLPIDIMCLSVWDDPAQIEHNPALMPQHTPALKACFCFADPHPTDMAGNGVVLERGAGSEQVGISRALTLKGGSTAEVAEDVLGALRSSAPEALTLHAWIRPAQLSWEDPVTGIFAAPDDAEVDTVFALQSDGRVIRLDLRPTPGPRSEILLTFAADQQAQSLGFVQQNEWAHLALVADGSHWRLYINSALSGEAAAPLNTARVTRIALGGLDGGGIAETQFRGHVCSFGIWSAALSADRIRAVSESLEFFDDACIAWYGLGDSMRLADSLLGSPLIVRGGGSVQEVVGPVSALRDAVESHAYARFKKAATTVPASAAWAGARMETIDGVNTGSAASTSDASQLRAALSVLRPGMEAVDLDQLVSNLARQASAAAPPTAYSVQTTPKAALLATTALSSQCGGALVAIICDVVAIILSAAGFAIGASVVRKAIGGPITRNLAKLIKTLKTIDFAKVEGVRRSTPIFLRLVSALFGTTSGMPSFRAIIQSIFSEFRWWDIAFFAANVGLLVTSIIFTGGGAVIVILATLTVAVAALARDITLYVDAGCHQQW